MHTELIGAAAVRGFKSAALSPTGRRRERRNSAAEDVLMICFDCATLYLFDHVTVLTSDPLLPGTSGLITFRYISFIIL